MKKLKRYKLFWIVFDLMLRIPDYRAFFAECYYECARFFPDTCDPVLEQLTDRLVHSIVCGPERTMTLFEVKTRCHQLIKSLKELER